MAGRGPQTFQKRQKEQKRKEKQEDKRAKRLQRKQEGPADGTENLDDDIEMAYADPDLDRGEYAVNPSLQKD
ncbi:MAG: hypothetical protein ABI693_30285 [Bryobacteraceae bacterium]